MVVEVQREEVVGEGHRLDKLLGDPLAGDFGRQHLADLSEF
jgi:hypothetical protein